MRELAKRFHISDVGLKKVCTRNRIPVPAQGHWQKLKAGKQSRRIPLPAMKHPPTISFMPRPPSATAGAEPPAPDPAAEIEKELRPVEVAETLACPHSVTSAMREELNRKTPDDYGAIHCIEPDVLPARIHPGSRGPAAPDRRRAAQGLRATRLRAEGWQSRPSDRQRASDRRGRRSLLDFDRGADAPRNA